MLKIIAGLGGKSKYLIGQITPPTKNGHVIPTVPMYLLCRETTAKGIGFTKSVRKEDP